MSDGELNNCITSTETKKTSNIKRMEIEMKRMTKSFVAMFIACFTILLSVGAAFAGDNAKWGLNEGGLWYSGYKGAYCHYYTTAGTHFATAKVKSNGSWIYDSKSKPAGQWAKADTGLQPNVTDWTYSYGIQ